MAAIVSACWKTRPTDVNSSVLTCSMHVRHVLRYFYCVFSHYIIYMFISLHGFYLFFHCDVWQYLPASFGKGTFFAITAKCIGIVAWNLQNWQRKPRPFGRYFWWNSTMWYGDSSMTSGHWTRAFRFQCMPSSQNTNICNLVQKSLVPRLWSSPVRWGTEESTCSSDAGTGHSAHSFYLFNFFMMYPGIF